MRVEDALGTSSLGLDFVIAAGELGCLAVSITSGEERRCE
jgi:hypothetical protein